MKKTTLSMRLAAAESDGSLYIPQTRADRSCMKRALSRGRVIQPIPGAYARPTFLADVLQSGTSHDVARILINGAAAAHPSWTFCLSSAALLHGLDISYELTKKIYVISDKHVSHHFHRIHHCYRSKRRPTDMVDGITVTTLWDTVVDACLEYPFCHALVIADSALRMTSTPRETFEKLLSRDARGRTGIERARLVARHASGLSESGGESLLRAYLIQHGYAIPQLQVNLKNPLDPSRPYRVDFLWILDDGRVIIGEFDGKAKYRDPEMIGPDDEFSVRFRERQRESRLTLLGYPVLRFSWDDLLHPNRLEHLLHLAGIPKNRELEEENSALFASLGY